MIVSHIGWHTKEIMLKKLKNVKMNGSTQFNETHISYGEKIKYMYKKINSM
jgi:hypothetical protein